ncbi:hypothetical protein MTO96_042151, partial [Rhipicephalus appendiculatus]
DWNQLNQLAAVAKFHSLIADQVNHPKVIRCSEHAPDLLG